MPAPINYNLDVANPINLAVKGYQTGIAMRQYAQKQAKDEEDRKRIVTMRKDLTTLSQKPDATGEDYSQLMLKYPEMSEKFKKSWDVLNEQQQQSQLSSMSQIYSALESGNPDIAKNILETQKKAALNAGLQDEANKADIMIKQITTSPDAAKLSSRLALSSILGPQKFAETFKALSTKEGTFRVLSQAEKKTLRLDEVKPFQIDSKGKIMPIGGGGITVNVGEKGKFGTIPPGYVLKENKEDGTYTMEVIPGGPADIKAKEIAKKKIETVTAKKRSTDLVIQDIGRLKNLVKTAPWFSPISGVIGSKIFPKLRQNRVNAEQLKTTIVANLGFDRLQRMRNASQTGGALGQISERENELLQSTMGSLEFAQSENQLIENLNRLSELYNKIIHGIGSNDILNEKQASTTVEPQTKVKQVEKAVIEPVTAKIEQFEKQLNRKLTDAEKEALKGT